jgi:kynurenine formamidase
MNFQSPFQPNFQERANALGQTMPSSALGFELALQVENAKWFDLAQTHDAASCTRIVKRDAEPLAPIIRQGFLLDVAYSKKMSVLPDDYAITADDLETTMKGQGRLIMPGGVLLIRTGFGQFWGNAAKYPHAARLSADAQQWILAKRPNALGVDMALRDTSRAELCERNGILIIEHLNLEGLAADYIDHMLFVAAPAQTQGVTSVPVRPLAVEVQMQSPEFMQV